MHKRIDFELREVFVLVGIIVSDLAAALAKVLQIGFAVRVIL